MADNDEIIAQFIDITGVDRKKAEFFLQSANFQLDVALISFYENAPNRSDSSDDDDNVVETSDASKNVTNKPTSGRSNFATISSIRDVEKEGDDKGQAFYAGGSEHSGQQVLGPPRKNPIKDMVSEIFRQAQGGNMEQFEPSHDESEPRFRSFGGTGYRLGQTDDDSKEIPSSSKGKKREEHDTVTIKVYRQGFTVDDGDLRTYEEPRNREFFESITRNEIPAELRKQGKAMVHVNVEDHLSEEYVKKAPAFKAFTGSGHTLGSPTPPTTEDTITTTTATAANPAGSNADNEAKAIEGLRVNQQEPTTSLSIRLADGSRLSTRFNLTHTVQDIRQYIVTARPEYSGRSFTLLTTFPNKELSNASDTIQEAGLQNAAILQRLK